MRRLGSRNREKQAPTVLRFLWGNLACTLLTPHNPWSVYRFLLGADA